MTDDCAICFESTPTTLKTPCGHIFHKECLAEITRPVCPVCKGGLKRFLHKFCGVSRREICRRVEEDGHRILAESLQSGCVEELSQEEIVFLVSRNIKTLSGDSPGSFARVIRDLLVDRVFDARQLFLDHSRYHGGKGVFFYEIMPQDVVQMALNPHCPSQATWFAEDFGYPEIPDLDEAARDLINRVKSSPHTSFGVLIAYYNGRALSICPRLLSIDPATIQQHVSESVGGGYVSGVTLELRVAHRDVMCSLTRSVSCRRSGHSPDQPNPEEELAVAVFDGATTT